MKTKGGLIDRNFTIGSDPEIGIYSTLSKKIVSSIPVLKTDKNNPIVLDRKTNTKFYADNVLAEFSFAPANSKEQFVDRFRNAFQKGQEFLGEDYKFALKAAHEYDSSEMKADYGINPLEIGCTPSFDFYKLQMCDSPQFTNNIRTQSTHIHIGNTKLQEFEAKHEGLKLIEIYLGLSSVIFDKDPSSLARRQYYGLSGSFRPCEYGAEYRIMSSYALNSPKLVDLTYDLVEHSLNHLFDGTGKDVINSLDTNQIRHSINSCNPKTAEELLKQAELPKNLMTRVKADYSTNFYENWGL